MTSTETEAEARQRRRREEAALLLLLLLGGSLGWTKADTRRLSTITTREVDAAQALWARLMPQRANLITGAGWLPDVQTYETGGALLTPPQIKSMALQFQSAVAGELQAVTAPLIVTETPIETWQAAIARLIRAAYVALAAVAVGGVSNLLPNDTAAVAASLQFTLERLERFAKQAEHQDAQAGTEPIIAARVDLYAAAGSEVFEDRRRISHKRATDDNGVALFLFERNRLAPADHCGPSELPGCPEESARGWVPIGKLSTPGHRTCLVNCKCRLEFAFNQSGKRPAA